MATVDTRVIGEQKQRCWNMRDAYYNCMDSKSADEEKCASELQNMKEACPRAWVRLFFSLINKPRNILRAICATTNVRCLIFANDTRPVSHQSSKWSSILLSKGSKNLSRDPIKNEIAEAFYSLQTAQHDSHFF